MPKSLPGPVNQDVINPYSGGAWVYLCEIVIPTQSTQRLARNTENITYDGKVWLKHNLDMSDQVFSNDANIPRITLRIFHKQELEDAINETLGGLDGSAKIIKVGEKFLDVPIPALEADYDIIASESDSSWVTITLGIPNPLTQRIPLRNYNSSACPWATPSLFKGVECQYAGAHNSCRGDYADCRAKANQVHFGGQLGLDPNGMRL